MGTVEHTFTRKRPNGGQRFLSDISMANTCHVYRMNKCALILMTPDHYLYLQFLIRKIYLSEFLIQADLFRL
jgi:hypothetical protein